MPRSAHPRHELQHPAAAEQFLTREVRVKLPAKEIEFPERNDALLRDLADKTSGDYFVGVPTAVGENGTGHAGLPALIKPQDQVTILPGTPITMLRGGIFFPSVIRLPAAIKHSSPISASSSTIVFKPERFSVPRRM